MNLFKYLLHKSFLGLQSLGEKSILSNKFSTCKRSLLSHLRAAASLSFSCHGKTCKRRIFGRLKTVIFSLQAVRFG